MQCNVSSISRDDSDNKNKESANSLQNNEKSNKNLKQTKKPNEKTQTEIITLKIKIQMKKIGRPLYEKERYREQRP